MRFQDVQRPNRPLQMPVDEEVLRRICIRVLGRGTVLVDHEHVQSGRFNTTYRLRFADRRPLILRLAPPPDARLFRHEADLMRRECAIQRYLATVGPVIPKLVAADLSMTLTPRHWMLLECLEGEPWSELADRLGPDDSVAIWQQFGSHVRRIHAIPGRRHGWPLAADRQGYSHWLRQLVGLHALDLRDLGLTVDGLGLFQDLLVRGSALIDQVGAPRLVHGDLWPPNVLPTQRQGRWSISGILDAERAFWGEPAAEWIFSFLDIPDAFWRTYGRSYSEACLDHGATFRRRCYEARGALQLILDGERHGFATAFAREDFLTSLTRIEDLLARSTPRRQPEHQRQFRLSRTMFDANHHGQLLNIKHQ